MAVIFIDAAAEILKDELHPWLLQETMDGVVSESLDAVIIAAAQGYRRGDILDAQPASVVLHEAATRVEQRLRSWAQAHSPLRWLWMLRRLPEIVFAGPLRTNLTYDLALAEVITAGSSKRETANATEDSVVWYETDVGVLRQLARFCCGVRVLSHLHSMQRWAGKGVPIRFTRRARFEPHPTREMRLAVTLYDDRVASRRTPSARFGSIIAEPWRSGATFGVLRVGRTAPHQLEFGHGADQAVVSATYRAELWDLSRLGDLSGDERLGAASLLTAEAALCVLLMRVAIGYVRKHKFGWRGLVQRGYLLSGKQLIAEQLESVLSTDDPIVGLLAPSSIPGSVEELIERARRADGRTWPLVPGPLVRLEGDVLCLDLASTSSRFDKLTLFPKIEGAGSNARGDHFEAAVQSAIDRTPWKPGDDIGRLRRKQLRFDGRYVTDFDALGTLGTTLIAVSCKSIADQGVYETGAFKAVRNGALAVETAVREWKDRIQFLRHHPRGENYDLSRFTSIVGVVCTPDVIFVPLGVATESVAPRLTAACTVEELERWLASV